MKCGDCSKWMKTSLCPIEKGFEKNGGFPSSRWPACDAFDLDENRAKLLEELKRNLGTKA
jgi:hypothetical protein